jgi:GDP-4-dehydro-6-deoxy-D-mannose reductase
MNVLVTGCSGFVGRHLLAYAGARLDAHCIGTTRSPSNNHNTVYCELTDYRQVDDVIEQVHPELIFHAAGSFTNDFETDSLNNIVAARNILDAAVKHIPGARIMLMGSAAEYGDIDANDNPVNEQHMLSPISIYGWSKAAQSLLAPMYSSRYGIKVMVARTFNLLGEGMSGQLFTGHVEQQIRNVLAGEAERITVGSLDAKRDYIDIDSACAMYLAIATKGKAGEVYNVGSGKAISMRELLDIMLKTAGLDIDIVDERADDISKKEVSTIYADISKVTALMQ